MAPLISCSTHDPEVVETSIREILETTKLLALASISSARPAPWINTAYFSFDDDLRLHLLTSPSTVHGVNLEQNPAVAAAVFDSTQSPRSAKRGLQISGTCRRVGDSEIEEVCRAWAGRMIGEEGVDDFVTESETYESKLYRISPTVIKVFDEQTFGLETWVEATISA